jgi:hypothetical protein
MKGRLRIKLLLCAVLSVIVFSGVAWPTWPEPPLRNGMSRDEVEARFGKSGIRMTTNDGSPGDFGFGGPLADRMDFYPDESGVFENAKALRVYYVNDKVVAWEDLRPPLLLLDRIKKALGW